MLKPPCYNAPPVCHYDGVYVFFEHQPLPLNCSCFALDRNTRRHLTLSSSSDYTPISKLLIFISFFVFRCSHPPLPSSIMWVTSSALKAPSWSVSLQSIYPRHPRSPVSVRRLAGIRLMQSQQSWGSRAAVSKAARPFRTSRNSMN